MFPDSKNSEPFALLYIGRMNMSSVSPSQDKQYAQLYGKHCRDSEKKYLYAAF